MLNTALPRTLFDKIWARHQILKVEGNVLLHVATHLVHDGYRPAFQALQNQIIRLSK